MTILYIETNFLMSVATGRDPDALALISNPHPAIRVFMPSVCYLEALSTLEVDRKHMEHFRKSLEERANEYGRDLVSAKSLRLFRSLYRSHTKVGDQFKDFENRLLGAIVAVSNLAETIEPSPRIIQASIAQRIIATDLTDNLILHCICDHATRDRDEEKVLLTGNTKDFGKDDVKKFLRNSGISKTFTNSRPFLDWGESKTVAVPGASTVPGEDSTQADNEPQ